jgi:hypothetical protein
MAHTADEFHVVIRRGNASNPDTAVDMVLIDDLGVLQSVVALLAKRFGVEVRERASARPTVVPLPKPAGTP